ncbi:hypothetical protein I551_4653 [Mycobacterium ulcerans str. Harvey]|uniref:Uncharacterized protein n=1 Tax=Mycobacterium ulcerans str. Harvey TaxID=1299332 RepID=A0ABP3AGG9_MYCUL|nr:hypothetical protein I551_4653 [Mycobacterium ulcerans str. Harvey]
MSNLNLAEQNFVRHSTGLLWWIQTNRRMRSPTLMQSFPVFG